MTTRPGTGDRHHRFTQAISRRGLLAGTAGIGVAAALAGCGPSGRSAGNGTGSGAGGEFQYPTHRAFDGAPAEFPAADGGIPAGYTTLPSELASTGSVPLPASDPISMLIQGSAPAVPFEENAYYRALTADAGTQFEVAFGGYGTYTDKFQVTIASDDLPDVVMMTNVRQLPELLEAKFTDLSEFLSGDAVLDYPSLATFRREHWKVGVLNNRLWGVAQPRPSAEGVLLQARGDLLAERGVDPSTTLSNGEDFLSLLAELTDPKAEVFAMAQVPTDWLIRLVVEMHGAPNGWREQGGSFTHQYETPEMAAAIEQMAAIWKAGYLHPESFTKPDSSGWWQAGTISLQINGVSGWTANAQQHPEWNMTGFIAPKWQGGGVAAKHTADAAYPSYAAIRKQDSPDRVREILRVMDYIASPFGTEEWLTVNYGVEGKHYTLVDGNPEATDLIDKEEFKIGYLGSQENAQLYVPGGHDVVRAQHEFLSAVMPTGEADASDGLYSDSATSKGPTAKRTVVDAIAAIIQGRKSMSEWEGIVAGWRKAAGDAMRTEYEEAFGAAQ